MANTITDHWIASPHGRLFARCWQPVPHAAGYGPAPIVLFHDSLGCIRLWRSFPALLAEQTGRQVIAYDRLGFGQSDARTERLGLDFIQEEATVFFPAVQRHFGLDRFIALGHSVGGGMAVHCAAHHAAACIALITESAQAFVEDKTLAGIAEAKIQFQQDKSFEQLQKYHDSKTRWVLNAWTDTWLSPHFADWSLRDILPKVLCPALVIHGGEDEYGSSKHPESIASLISGPTQLEIMPGIRHVPHREQEAWVVKRIADYLISATREVTCEGDAPPIPVDTGIAFQSTVRLPN